LVSTMVDYPAFRSRKLVNFEQQLEWLVMDNLSDSVGAVYQALKSLGRETELVMYPGEYHGFQNAVPYQGLS
jgi:hypothetical protein